MSSIFFYQIINLYIYTYMNICLRLKCKLQFLQMLNYFLIYSSSLYFPMSVYFTIFIPEIINLN